MSESTQSAKGWEGQIVDGKFPLLQLLGETDHSAVFLTEYGDGQTKKRAAIKLVAAEGSNAELLLANWNYAAHLTHPNLLQLFRCGRCAIHGNDILYLVMERAEENLADILPQRALTAAETQDMLLPVLDALEYLHGKGLVHRDIKPANILAAGDQLKLSSDAITRVAEGLAVPKKTSVYDPPEAISGVLSPAGDVWALGTTLVEVLTQKLPEWQPGLHREPVVSANVPAPFQEIARHCLRLEPDRRMRVADIAARLNPRAAAAPAVMASAAAAGAGVLSAAGTGAVAAAPMAAPRRPVVSETPPRRPTSRIAPPTSQPELYAAPKTRSRFVVPLLIVGAVVFAVILTVPRLLTNRPTTTANLNKAASGAAKTPPETAQSVPAAVTTAKTDVKANQQAAPGQPLRSVSSAAASAEPGAKANQDNAAPDRALKAASEKETPAAVSSTAQPTPVAPVRVAAAGHPKGEVLDQVLPDVPQKARDTIQGRLRVGVKVHVDAAGAVTGAELDSPAPSKYFADWALQAAKKWAFSPPEVNGKSVESDWLLRFIFTQSDTTVTPTQTAP